MWREIPGAVIFIIFLAGFVFLMNVIADPKFNGNANYYSIIAGAVIAFAILMTYWERIFPAGD